MANICDNELRASSPNSRTLAQIKDWFEENIIEFDFDEDENILFFKFESKWDFPRELMTELYEYIEDKKELNMECLSVEWGCLYCVFHVCDENGWRIVE